MIRGIIFDISAVKPDISMFAATAAKIGLKLCVCGAKDKAQLDEVLANANLKGSSLDCIVYENEVKNRKPSGDIYRYCTLKLGISPDECIVVETSVDGHRAAKDALCRSIGLAEHMSFIPQLEAGADIIYYDSLPWLLNDFLSLDQFDGFILEETRKFFYRTVVGDLIDAALKTQENAYAPYSKFKVGAALLTEKNGVYVGCNVENASFGGTICAERGAAMAALASEGRTSFKMLVVASSADDPAPPCAICRQFLSEFMSPNGQVYLVSRTSGVMKHYSFGSLLPCSFTEF